MKKQTKNTIFIISVIVILVGSLFALSILTKKQNTPSNNFITYDEYLNEEKSHTEEDKSKEKSYNVKDFSWEEQPLIGDADAPVTMVLYSDFSCGHCQNFEKVMFPIIEEKLLDTGKARLQIVNYAFLNDSSFKAAVAADSVFRQNPDEYLTYYKAIFGIQNTQISNWASEKTLVNLAKDLKLDINYETLGKDIKEYKGLRSVYQDRAYATSIGVQGTPNLTVDGMTVDPFNEEDFVKLVDSIIQANEEAENEETKVIEGGDTNE